MRRGRGRAHHRQRANARSTQRQYRQTPSVGIAEIHRPSRAVRGNQNRPAAYSLPSHRATTARAYRLVEARTTPLRPRCFAPRHGGDNIIINATRDIVKGRKGKERGRYIPILREDVAEYLRRHREDEAHYVVGSPTTTANAWDATNADDKVPELYSQIADETGVEILRDLRSHSWRATLHGVYADVMDARTRADIFGHTEQIADEYYNDRANVEALIRATAQARTPADTPK